MNGFGHLTRIPEHQRLWTLAADGRSGPKADITTQDGSSGDANIRRQKRPALAPPAPTVLETYLVVFDLTWLSLTKRSQNDDAAPNPARKRTDWRLRSHRSTRPWRHRCCGRERTYSKGRCAWAGCVRPEASSDQTSRFRHRYHAAWHNDLREYAPAAYVLPKNGHRLVGTERRVKGISAEGNGKVTRA